MYITTEQRTALDTDTTSVQRTVVHITSVQRTVVYIVTSVQRTAVDITSVIAKNSCGDYNSAMNSCVYYISAKNIFRYSNYISEEDRCGYNFSAKNRGRVRKLQAIKKELLHTHKKNTIKIQ